MFMLKLIIGQKGTGKTKMLIEKANSALKSESGNVICIEKGSKLKFDLNYNIRLIDIDEFNINKFTEFYGFICGLLGCDRDITAIFIDSILKICPESTDVFETFLDKLDTFTNKLQVKFYITASADINEMTDKIKKYF